MRSLAGTRTTNCFAVASKWRVIGSAGANKYFAYPLPGIVAELREALYLELAPIASDWMGDLGQQKEFPADLQSFLQLCHASGQKRPTPILLRYRAGDFNCLHQDVYGELFFPSK